MFTRHTCNALVALSLSLAVLPACDDKKSDETTEEDDDGESKKKKRKKKRKKKSDDDDGDKDTSASTNKPRSGSRAPTGAAGLRDAVTKRKRTLPWKQGDFDNAKAINGKWETGDPACNRLANACTKCRDRVNQIEKDKRLWSTTVMHCMKVKDQAKKLSDKKKAGKCSRAIEIMKKKPDCVRGIFGALIAIGG